MGLPTVCWYTVDVVALFKHKLICYLSQFSLRDVFDIKKKCVYTPDEGLTDWNIVKIVNIPAGSEMVRVFLIFIHDIYIVEFF